MAKSPEWEAELARTDAEQMATRTPGDTPVRKTSEQAKLEAEGIAKGENRPQMLECPHCGQWVDMTSATLARVPLWNMVCRRPACGKPLAERPKEGVKA